MNLCFIIEWCYLSLADHSVSNLTTSDRDFCMNHYKSENMFYRTKFKFINFYSTDFNIIKMVGGYIIDDENANSKFWFGYACFINIFVSLLGNIVQVLHLFELTSLIKLCESGYLIAVSCMSSIKAYYLFRNRKHFLELISFLKVEKFFPRNEEQELMARGALRIYQRMKYSLLFVCTLSATGAMTTPMFNMQEGRLPFAAWYPFDTTPVPVFVLVYIHQCIAVVYISFINVYTDIIVSGFTTYAGIQCDFLCYNLSNLDEEELETGLRECVEYHRSIVR